MIRLIPTTECRENPVVTDDLLDEIQQILNDFENTDPGFSEVSEIPGFDGIDFLLGAEGCVLEFFIKDKRVFDAICDNVKLVGTISQKRNIAEHTVEQVMMIIHNPYIAEIGKDYVSNENSSHYGSYVLSIIRGYDGITMAFGEALYQEPKNYYLKELFASFIVLWRILKQPQSN